MAIKANRRLEVNQLRISCGFRNRLAGRTGALPGLNERCACIRLPRLPGRAPGSWKIGRGRAQ